MYYRKKCKYGNKCGFNNCEFLHPDNPNHQNYTVNIDNNKYIDEDRNRRMDTHRDLNRNGYNNIGGYARNVDGNRDRSMDRDRNRDRSMDRNRNRNNNQNRYKEININGYSDNPKPNDIVNEEKNTPNFNKNPVMDNNDHSYEKQKENRSLSPKKNNDDIKSPKKSNNDIKIENNRQRISNISTKTPSLEQQQENEKIYKKQMQHYVIDSSVTNEREIECDIDFFKGLNHSGSFLLDDIKKDEHIIFGENLENISNIENFEREKASFISYLKNGSTTINKLAYYGIINITYNQYVTGCKYFNEDWFANEYQFHVVRKILIDFETLEKCNQLISKINIIQIISSNLCYVDSSKIYDDKLNNECEDIFDFMLDSKLLIKHKNYHIEYYESHLIHHYYDELIKKFRLLYNNNNNNNNNNSTYNQIKNVDKFQHLTPIINENKICLVDTHFCEEYYLTDLRVNYNGHSFINFEQNCSKYVVINALIQEIKTKQKNNNSSNNPSNNLIIITNNLINVKDIYNLISTFDEICGGVKKITIFFDSIDNTNLNFFANQLFKQKKCALIIYSTNKYDKIKKAIKDDNNISLDELSAFYEDDNDNNEDEIKDEYEDYNERLKNYILSDGRLKIENDFDIYNIISNHIKSSTSYENTILCSDNSNFEQFFNSYFCINNIINPDTQLTFNSFSYFNEESGCFRDKTLMELKENLKEKNYNEKIFKLIVPFNSFSTKTKSIIYFTSELKLENVYSLMKKCKYDIVVYIISNDKYFY